MKENYNSVFQNYTWFFSKDNDFSLSELLYLVIMLYIILVPS